VNRVKLLKAAPFLALLIVIILIPFFLTNAYYLGVITLIFINVLLAASLWFIITTGQVSLGHAGFAAIGAYISAAMVTAYGQSSWLGLIVGIIASAIVAAVIGYITLRITGIYFIVVTLALGQIINIIFGMIDYPFGGLIGLMDLPPPDPIVIPGLPAIEFTSKISIYYLVLVFVLIGILIMHRLNRSRIGHIYDGISQRSNLAEHIGINIMAYKVQAFVIGCIFAGLAGILYTYYTGSIIPSSFTLGQSTYYLVYVAVGGGANIAGPILGTVVLNIMSIFLRPIKEFEPIIYGVILIVVILFFKGGILGFIQRLLKGFGRSSTSKKSNEDSLI